MSISVLSGKVFLLVTGASCIISRQIAESFSTLLAPSSHVLLLASNEKVLKQIASNISSNDVKADYASVNLGTAGKDELEAIILKSLSGRNPDTFDRMVVVHNSATIGDVTETTNQMLDLNKWRSYYDLNAFLPFILNGLLMKLFKTTPEKLVVSISSSWAIKPVEYIGYFCTGKAAKLMFFKVFAAENPDVNVLNYSPGFVVTDMYNEVRLNSGNKKIKTLLNDMRDSNNTITAAQTTNRLLAVLKEQKYKSGDYVDYFDGI